MKILFISHAKEDSGWGFCGRQELKFLSKYFDVVSRTINFQPKINYDWMQELENKTLDGVTHVIQYVLPNHVQRFPNVRNIGYHEIETSDIKYSTFVESMAASLDEIWVVNSDAKKTLEKNINNIPIYVMYHSVDASIYKTKYKKLLLPINGNFVFYTISENVSRKNLFDLIAAFHLEFDPTEPVSLLIKTNDQTGAEEIIKDVKTGLRLYKQYKDYKSEIIISSRLTDHEIYGLHQSSDCYISASFGESWNQPLVDAIGFGNMTLAPNQGGPKDILQHEENKICGYETFCINDTPFLNYQNGWDSWYQIYVDQLMSGMRKAFNNQLNIESIEKFSEENRINFIKERLNNE